MSKTAILIFWIIWLLDVLIALLGYREFISGAFGRYAAPSGKYIALWITLLLAALLIISGSLLLKNKGQINTAISIAAIPLVLALPYALWILSTMIFGKGNMWR